MSTADLIDRQAAIDALESFWDSISYQHSSLDEAMAVYADCKRIINNLPSAQPDVYEWCHDCKEYDQERHCCPRWNRVIRETLKDMQSERKRGKWIPKEERAKQEVFICSECGRWAYSPWIGSRKNPKPNWCKYSYCPNCGADMRGEQDGDA